MSLIFTQGTLDEIQRLYLIAKTRNTDYSVV
jgi:hypothetical protein